MKELEGTQIVWFRDDLRISDNPALSAAWARGKPVAAVYVLDDHAQRRPLGAAARWWLNGSLEALSARLADLGVPLILRRGDTVAILTELARATGAQAIFHSICVDDVASRIEADLARAMCEQNVEVHAFDSGFLYPPGSIRTAAGESFRVFSPFWRAALASGQPRAPLPAPQGRRAAPHQVASDDLVAWKLHPEKPDWASGFTSVFEPGEAGGEKRLSAFIAHGLAGYGDLRDRPDLPSTSLLSPHLRFGDVSPHRVWQAAANAEERNAASVRDVQKFHAELGWREFSHHLLAAFPDLGRRNFQKRFDRFPWHEDEAALHAWQRGQTGYPIIDAGMRQLWITGHMHNRVRMIAASFLVKHLLIDWRHGEAWFWDTLVDACPANNTASWQWVAGSGADAAPYFRIFNPVLQGMKFDPEGEYVRRYVPELARLPSEFIHRPWDAGGLVLAEAGVRLGRDYPQPLIALEEGRARALAAFARIQNDGATV